MPHTTLSEPPTTTPLFANLNVKELLRGPGSLFRFLIGTVWADWFGLITAKVNPLLVKQTLDFPATAAQTSSSLTVTVTGAQTDHHAEVIPPPASVVANSLYWAYVSAVNVVTVFFCNFSAAAINPASGEFTVVVRK